jgi:hypothetical protein
MGCLPNSIGFSYIAHRKVQRFIRLFIIGLRARAVSIKTHLQSNYDIYQFYFPLTEPTNAMRFSSTSTSRGALLTKICTVSLLLSPILAAPAQDGKYEYIIIGSGPGGAGLAANLAVAGHRTLLLEAGADHTEAPIQKIPSFANPASEDPDMRWDFFVKHYSDPEQQRRDNKFTYQLPNGTFYVGLDPPKNAKPLGIYYPRTGSLGGCATHNAEVSVLPSNSDWQYIADITGDRSWR